MVRDATECPDPIRSKDDKYDSDFEIWDQAQRLAGFSSVTKQKCAIKLSKATD